MNSREIVRRVLEYDGPPRIGLTFSDYDGRPRINDISWCGPSPDPERPEEAWRDDDAGGEVTRDEWGCVWRRIKGKTVGGEVIRPALGTWDDLATYQPPSLVNPARYENCARQREMHPDMYMIGGIVCCSFDRARYLRGMEQYLFDCAASPEMVRRLNRMVNDIALAQVDIYADAGADGVFFCEDWGTEDRLLVSPRMWEAIFRPDFERLIGHAHRRGLTVWMHSCGYVRDIVPALVDTGMDVLQLDQPELSDLDFLAEFSGRVTYWCPVDIQKILPTGDRALIESRARAMLEKLAGRGGGFIAKDYGDNASLGVDPLWQHWAYEVFTAEGRYE
jgi:hypothetical protein